MSEHLTYKIFAVINQLKANVTKIFDYFTASFFSRILVEERRL